MLRTGGGGLLRELPALIRAQAAAVKPRSRGSILAPAPQEKHGQRKDEDCLKHDVERVHVLALQHDQPGKRRDGDKSPIEKYLYVFKGL